MFTIKKTINNKIERFKAQLITHGFNQAYNTDYIKTFALIIQINTLCLFLIIIAKKDLKYSYFNIKNTFIKSYLKKDIFLTLFNGIIIIINKVLKALRSLYNLK